MGRVRCRASLSCFKTRPVIWMPSQLEHELSKVSAACEMKDGTVEDSVQSRDATRPSPDPSIKQKIISKMEALKTRQAYWTRRLAESVPAETLYTVPCSDPSALCENDCSSRIDAWFRKNLAQAAHMTDYTVQFLLMELESVGNIRLEEGCPSDRWCGAWVSLLHASTYTRGARLRLSLCSPQQVHFLL